MIRYNHKRLQSFVFLLLIIVLFVFFALVISCSTGRRLHGFHHFFGHELNTCKCLGINIFISRFLPCLLVP